MSRLEIIGQLRAHLTDVMPDAETMWQTQPAIRRGWLSRGQQVGNTRPVFRGHLAVDSDHAYVTLSERFAPLGYTPLLHRDGDYDVIEALRKISRSAREGRPKAMRWLPNVVLLLLTVVTTTLVGAIMEQSQALIEDPALFLQRPALILTGLPASLTIMSILGIHELGHYFVARRHGLDTTLPYFIPVPFGFGTFGAIIRIRSPWHNRKALFDVGLAGPIAGLVVALPLFFVGLMLSPHQPPIPESTPLGSPLLLSWMEDIVYGLRGIPENHEIYVNAMTFAAWYGLVVTGYNLLPVGQLDGGHVATALLGRWARVLGTIVLVALVALGALVWQGWYIWAALIFFLGRRHPDPHNTVAPLGKTRTIVGLLVFVLLALLFTPSPFPM
jgi:membrane-associated protease RseP (regulator of RpoE activity)